MIVYVENPKKSNPKRYYKQEISTGEDMEKLKPL